MQSKHGSLEGVILSTLWKLEEKGIYTNTVKNVFEYLNRTIEQKRAYTTIKTVMDRLVEKKILSRYKKDKKFYYRTSFTNYEMMVKSLEELAEKYCSGDINKVASVLESIMREPHLVGHVNE